VHLPTRSLHVVGDPVRLTQVVANLLNNASKFSEDGDAISITLESSAPEDTPGAEAVVRVVDVGVGISPALLPRIFVPFVQASRLAARDQGGLGIGLALVRSLVALHGGVVSAHSAGDGEGSEFVIRLPLVATAEPRPETPRASAPRKSEPSGLKVLLVDDNVDAATSLGMLLRLNGHEVHVENDGSSALAAVDAFVPDLAILDIGMPGMNGYELARHLRQRPELSDLALVALSGYGHDQHVKDAIAVGFDRQLIKPVDPLVLDALLEDVARTRRDSVAQ
jgi:two-component system CheB/CheR fusion protein